MVDMIIKEHKKDRIYSNPHLFILNKGKNSGKPQKQPYANSFVVIFKTGEDCENHLNIAEALWKTKFWQKYLLGKSILYLKLQYFQFEFPIQAKILMEEFDEHVKKVALIKLQKIREENYIKNQVLIYETKRNLMYRGIRARNANK